MAEPIRVIIKDDSGTATITSGSKNPANTNKSPNPQAKKNKSAAMAQSAATMIAMRSINYATSNIGKWTGNTSNQTTINNVKTAIGYGMAFAVNPVLGAITVALDGATNAIDMFYENRKNQRISQEAMSRIGGKGGYRK